MNIYYIMYTKLKFYGNKVHMCITILNKTRSDIS